MSLYLPVCYLGEICLWPNSEDVAPTGVLLAEALMVDREYEP